MLENYLACPYNHLNLQIGFSNNLKHRSKHPSGQLQQTKHTKANRHVQVLLCIQFQESDLKLKSWTKPPAGVYVSKLHKTDVRDILYFWVTSDLLDSCHKPTRDTAPVMSPNLIWLYFKNLITEDGNSKEVFLSRTAGGSTVPVMSRCGVEIKFWAAHKTSELKVTLHVTQNWSNFVPPVSSSWYWGIRWTGFSR